MTHIKHIHFEKLREGKTDCPSDLSLDRWVLETNSAAERQSIAAHLLACALCEERVELRRLGLAAYPTIDDARQIEEIQLRLTELPAVGALPLLFFRHQPTHRNPQ